MMKRIKIRNKLTMKKKRKVRKKNHFQYFQVKKQLKKKMNNFQKRKKKIHFLYFQVHTKIKKLTVKAVEDAKTYKLI